VHQHPRGSNHASNKGAEMAAAMLQQEGAIILAGSRAFLCLLVSPGGKAK